MDVGEHQYYRIAASDVLIHAVFILIVINVVFTIRVVNVLKLSLHSNA